MIAFLKKRVGMVARDSYALIRQRAISFHSVTGSPSQRTGNVLLLLLAASAWHSAGYHWLLNAAN
jgi:hypothetical protein